jgi:hypothetical protein
MRGLRSFIGLLTILIALGAYLYFVESKRTPGGDVEEKPEVFTVESEKIDEITIKSESGDTTTLKKSGTEWQIVAPAPAQADSSEVSGILTNLSSLDEQRLIDENPGNLEEFGLAKPRIEVTFKAGGQEQRLLIGSKTPTGADLYAKTAAAPKVFLIASYLDSTFNRSTFDLRDKTALKIERDAVDSLEITTADRTLKFGKIEGEWQVTQPAVPRSDASTIEGLLSRIDGLQMKSVASADGSELSNYGLDKPAASVRVGSGSSQATLLVGSAAEEGTVYAKDASRPEVFTIESSLLDDLKKDAGEYRQKDLFDARAFNTTGIEVARGGATTVFEKTTVKDKDGKEEQKWKQTAPAGKDVDRATIDTLLSSLTSARADAFVDKAPAEAKTEAVFALKFDDGKQERVTFQRAGADAYAIREGSPGAAKLAASTLDQILKSLDAVK